MGVMSARKKKLRLPSLSAIENCWQREATCVAIEHVRAAISGGAVPPNTPVGRLSEIELGWFVAGALFGWINTRARQAVDNGVGVNKHIRDTGLEPDPWDAGAIETILPELAKSEIDWSKSLAQFSREEMIAFLGDAYNLIGKAMLVRDSGEQLVTRRLPLGTAEQADWDDKLPPMLCDDEKVESIAEEKLHEHLSSEDDY
jgi:hypothetical protein